MATEFRVIIEDKPGSLAQLGGDLSDARVNIEAIHAMSREGRSFVEFIPNNQTRAVQALDTAEVSYTKREVLVVRVLDEPGMLGDVHL